MKKKILLWVIVNLFLVSFVSGLGCTTGSCVPYLNQDNLDVWLMFNDTNTVLKNYGNKSIIDTLTCPSNPTTGQTDPYGGTNAYTFDYGNYCWNHTYFSELGYAGDLTFAMWLKLTTSPPKNGVAFSTNDAGNADHLRISYLTGDSTFTIDTQDGSAVTSVAGYPRTHWYLVVGRRKGLNQTIFINGTQAVNSNTLGGVTDLPDSDLEIGRFSSQEDNYVDGDIADFSLFGRALSDAEIQCLYDGSCEAVADTTPPEVSIIHPVYATYDTSSIDLNFSVYDENLDSCFYSLDGGANDTSICPSGVPTNITLSLPEGDHNIRLCARDSTGNENCDYVSFSIVCVPGGAYESRHDVENKFVYSDDYLFVIFDNGIKKFYKLNYWVWRK